MTMTDTAADDVDISDGDDWWGLARCQGMNTDLFFPAEPDRVPSAVQVACDGCPVRQPCGEHALRHEQYGVWAGMSEQRREKLRRTLRIRLETHTPPRDMVARMWRRGMTVPDIAGEVGTTRRTVYRLLHSAGILLTAPDSQEQAL